MIIDGKIIAAELIARMKSRLAAVSTKSYFGAAVIGDDPASLFFLRQKEAVARELGVDFRLYRLPADISTDHARREVGRLAAPKRCGGFIVQLPLPDHLANRHFILNAIPKQKDVDVLSESSLGAFYTERNPILPPSVATLTELLERYYPHNLREATVAVIGTGMLVGRPIAFYLQNRVAELMVFDSQLKNLHDRLIEADIVVSGAGYAKLFSAKHLRNNVFVADFGYGRSSDGMLSGDFDPSLGRGASEYGADGKNIIYTKTPGGTGPILVAKLYENFLRLNRLNP